MMRTSIFIVAFATSACKTLYDKKNYVKSPAAGAISDSDWKYYYGYTDAEAKRPDGIEHIIVLTTQIPKHACPSDSDRPKDMREVVIGIDGTVGEMVIGARSGQYETSDDAFTYTKQTRNGSVAFVNPARPTAKQYQFATNGKIKVTKITKDSIEGMVVAKLNPEHFVNGKFKAKLCKWGQLN